MGKRWLFQMFSSPPSWIMLTFSGVIQKLFSFEKTNQRCSCICFLETYRFFTVMNKIEYDKATLPVEEKILNQNSSQRLSKDELITC